MTIVQPILIGKGEEKVYLKPEFANRHGLIAGATGTGKTVSLQVLAEGFSKIGVPVFMADVKGDLSGISAVGKPHPKIDERIEKIGIDDYTATSFPTIFWDIFGVSGHPIRATISDMGPLLLSRLLDLNDTQEGILNIAFKYADEEGLLLLDMDDLRSTLKFMGEHKKEFQNNYGNVSSSSIGAIQRRLLVIEEQGADKFFGEPALNLRDFMKTDSAGLGHVNILAADALMQSPRLYSTFLLWLLSELFENMPEVGDMDKPKLVFFFDEAHLLFEDAPKALTQKVEQVVKLIRSKGVGVYFITQNPLDIPDDVLGQLGNRIQHALRAFTPRDQKAVRAAAQTFRPNPKLDTEETITQMGVGEALVSTLEDDGVPSIVDRTLIRPPCSQMGPIEKNERFELIKNSQFYGEYEAEINRESAHEKLTARIQKDLEEAEKREKESEKKAAKASTPKRRSNRQSVGETFAKTIARTAGRAIVRGLLGSIFKGR